MEHINFLWLSPPAFNGMMCSLFQLFLLLKTKLLCSVWGSYSYLMNTGLKVKSSRCRLYIETKNCWYSRLRILQYISDLFIQLSLPAIHINEHCCYSRLRILQYISDLFIQLSLPAIHINEHCCYSRLHNILQCISDLFIQLSLPAIHRNKNIFRYSRLRILQYMSDLFIQLSLPAIHRNEKLLIF